MENNSTNAERQPLLKEQAKVCTKDNSAIVIWTKWKVIYNSVVLFLVFVGNMTSYKSLIEIQTSVNGDIGIYSIALGCFCKILSSFLGPKIVHIFTPKWALFMSSILIMCFTVANCFPTWYVLVPAGALVGVFSAPMWICYGVYVTSMGIEYARITKQDKEGVLNRLNGFMAAAVPCAIAMGSFWSSFILKNVRFDDLQDKISLLLFQNSTLKEVLQEADGDLTLSNSTHHILRCGPHYCPKERIVKPETVFPDVRVFYILLAVYAVHNLLAVILIVFGLHNLTPDQYNSKENKDSKEENYITTPSYIKRFFDWRFILLTPPMAYISFFMTLVVSMFPRAYITCTIGVEMIGYIFLARGLSDFVTCKVLGFFGQCCHRSFWLSIAFFSVLGASVLLLMWDYIPSEDTLITLFLFATVSGIVNSINTSQYTAFLGATFSDKKTEVFSYSQFIQSITGALGFYSNVYLCAKIQVYILIALTILAGVTYNIFCCCMNTTNQQALVIVTNVESSSESEEDKFIKVDRPVTYG